MLEQLAVIKADLGYLLEAVAVGQVTVAELRVQMDLIYVRLVQLLGMEVQTGQMGE